MNMQDFAALKAGDKIENPMSGSKGAVISITDSGVRVQWGASSMEFFYGVNSTAWMHWSKVEPVDDGYLPDDGRHREP